MYDKRIKEEFWTTLGKYLSLSPSASGEKISWINYKTGIRNVQFKMFAEGNIAGFSIEIAIPADDARHQLFQQLRSDQELLYQFTGSDWEWARDATDQRGAEISKLTRSLAGYNISRKEDWPDLISFFKTTITGVDQFWSEQKEFYQMIAG